MIRRSFLFGLTLFLSGSVTPVAAQPEPVTVFAAASLKNALEDAAKPFTASTGIQVRFSFAASSALARQIESGAPADLFASADLEWMDHLQQRNLIRTNTRVDLLGNRLVVIAPADSPLRELTFTPEAITQAAGNGRIATGEVTSVPAGMPRPLWSGSVSGRRSSHGLRNPRTCVRPSCLSHAVKRPSASSTRRTQRLIQR
jgi:ABC-type molybdate transport system substrate-binding protein